MTESDVESLSPLTSGDSEEEDLVEKFESLQRRKLDETLGQFGETLEKQGEDQRVSACHDDEQSSEE